MTSYRSQDVVSIPRVFAFIPKHDSQARHLAAESVALDQSPVSHGMLIRDVIVWLRGEDSDL